MSRFYRPLVVASVFLFSATTAFSQPQSVVDRFEVREHTLDDFTIPYRLFVPSPYDPAVAYPLVLTLHGSGQRGTENENQIATNRVATTWAEPAAQAVNPAFVVSPQAPPGGTFAFGSLDPTVIPNELATSLDLLDSLATEFNIDPDRVYITGLSMGGFGVFEGVFHDPDRFAAAIPMSSGYLPFAAADMGSVPFFVFHGQEDIAVPAGMSTQMISAFEELGRTAVYTDCGPHGCQPMSEAEIDSALAIRPDLVYVSHPEDGHVIWEESYDSQGLHDWLFDQHRLLPDAIQFGNPSDYPTWSGSVEVSWTAPNPDDSLEVWFSPNHGRTWELVASRIPNTGSYTFDTEAYADTPFGLLRMMLIGPDELVYARQRSTPFVIDNGGEVPPVLQLQDFQFRDIVFFDGQPIREGLVVTDTALVLKYRAGDAESPVVSASLHFSSDGGETYETIQEFDQETSGDLQSLLVDLRTLPNAPESQFRLEFSDGETTVSASTPVISKETPRQSSSVVEHVEGDGGAVISINFVAPELLTNHRYRIDFAVFESPPTTSRKTTSETKTYSVRDLDLDVEVFADFPVSGRESPMFDGIRLLVQDSPKAVDAERTGWAVGDSDLEVSVLARSSTFGDLLATPADYRLTVTEEVVDSSLALFGFTEKPLRFTVVNLTADEPRDILFADRNGIPSPLDRMFILEEDGEGILMPAWFLDFGSQTIPVEAGDVFEIVTRKPITDGDVFEFVGAIGVSVEEDGPIPHDFELGQNYPNPFSGLTTIPFRLADDVDAELTVFDALGRRVAVLVSGTKSRGDHRVDWDTSLMPSGVYFYRLETGGVVQTRSMLLTK